MYNQSRAFLTSRKARPVACAFRLLAAVAIAVSSLPLSILPPTAPTASAATPIFVRTNGSDTICNGTVNAGSSSFSGVNQPCAVRTIATAITLVDSAGTINVAGGDYTESLSIGKSLTITGAGAEATTIQAHTSPNMAVTGVITVLPTFTLTVTGVTIRHGRSLNIPGGGINNAGTLVLDQVAVTGNSAENHGGGIFNAATGNLTTKRSTISANANTLGGNGGGIHTNGTAAISNSTISGNSTDGGGGGISVNGATVTLTNVTTTNNHADADGSGQNGGGIFNSDGTVTVKNTLIAGNFDDSAGTNRPDCSGALTSQGNNLLGRGDGCTGLTHNANGDLVGTIASPINPLLVTLANNGGSTQTHALQSGSPAIDTAANAVCAALPVDNVDQRGTTRPQGTVCDIGAFELEATPSFDLTVSKSGSGSGTISSTPGGIDCGSDCSHTYFSGTPVALTATPGSGSLFAGWSDACSGSAPCNLTMDAAKAVTATFTLPTFTFPLTVNKTGTGTGTVTSSPLGINCGDDCSESYASDTSVALTASPSPSSQFIGWTGACTGAGNCNVTMNMQKDVTATFTALPGGPTQLAFISPQQTVTPGVLSQTITIQTQDATNTPVNVSSPLLVTLAANPSGGVFRNSTNTQTIASLTIGAGSNAESFKYQNDAPGVYTITVSAEGLTGAAQQITVEAPVTLSIADAQVAEGNAGTSILTFTVTRSGPAAAPVTVEYASTTGPISTAFTGICGNTGADFQPASGTLSIPAGQITGTINVTICGDTEVEPNETFVVSLSNPLGASITSGQAIGTITSDDIAPSIGTVRVVLNAVPDDAQDFQFTLQPSAFEPFLLDDDGDSVTPSTRAFEGLNAGVAYTVAMTPVAGWTLADITCTSSALVSAAANGKIVQLRAGEDVTCSFTVTKPVIFISASATGAAITEAQAGNLVYVAGSGLPAQIGFRVHVLAPTLGGTGCGNATAGVSLGSFTVSGSGTIDVSVTIPVECSGVVPFFAVSSGGSVLAQTTLSISPAVLSAIHGKVVDTQTQQGLDGVTVHLASARNGQRDALTSGGGRFTFTNVLSDGVYLTTDAQVDVGSIRYAGSLTPLSATVPLPAGAPGSGPASPLVLGLQPQGQFFTISGQVTGPAGDRIEVTAAGNPGAFRTLPFTLGGAPTPYSLFVPAGDYDLSVSPAPTDPTQGAQFIPQPPLRVQVSANLTQDFQLLLAGRTLNIRVVFSDNGEAIAGARVWAYQPLLGYSTDGHTDTQGNAVLNVVPATFKVGALLSGYPMPAEIPVTVTSEGTQTPNPALFRITRAAGALSVSGTVLLSGTPVASAGVRTLLVDPVSGTIQSQGLQTVTDQSGSYSFHSPPGARWLIQAAVPGHGSTSFRDTGIIIEDLAGFDLAFTRFVTVIGSVTMANNPANGALIGIHAIDAPSGNHAVADAAGQFAIPLLCPAGVGETFRWGIQPWVSGRGAFAPQEISIGSACTPPAPLVFSEDLGTIRVTWGEILPLAYISATQQPPASPRGNQAWLRDASTESLDVPVGTYSVQLMDPARGQFTRSNVQVTNGGTVEVEFDVNITPVTTIVGVVTNGQGAGIANARVSLVGITNPAFGAAASASSEGRYRIAVPQNAVYHLMVAAPGFIPSGARTISVGAQPREADIDLAPTFTTIGGAVEGPPAGTTITIIARTGDGRTAGVRVTAGTSTPYTIPVGGGTWRVRPYADGFTAVERSVTTTTCSGDACVVIAITDLNFTMTRSGEVNSGQTIQVTKSSGASLKDVQNRISLIFPAGSMGSGSEQVTITTRTTSEAPATALYSPLGGVAKDITIVDSNSEPVNTLTTGATVILDYTDQVPVAVVARDAGKLKAGYFDDTLGDWVPLDGCNNNHATPDGHVPGQAGAETTEHYIFTCIGVTHFSKFGVIAVQSAGQSTTIGDPAPPAPPAPAPSPGGAGGGGSAAPERAITLTIKDRAGTRAIGNADPGSEVLVIGEGFPAGTAELHGNGFAHGDIAACDPAGFTLLSDFTVASNGFFQRLVTVPFACAGTRLTIFAIFDGRAVSANITVTSVEPAIVAPASGFLSTDLAPLLSWTNPPGTTQVQVQVIPYNNDGPGINLIRDVESSYQVEAPVFGEGNYVMLPGMTYTWRVRTNRSSTGVGENDPGWSIWVSATFRTAPPASLTIGVAGPTPGTEVPTLTPFLAWTNSDARVFYYEVQVSKDKDFGPGAFLYWELRHGAVSNPPNSYQVPGAFPFEPNTDYYWRVRPRVQGDGIPVPWSLVWTFRTRR